MKKYVIDTHFLIWGLLETEQGKLSKKAEEIFVEIFMGEAEAFLSVIVIAEVIAYVMKEGDVELRDRVLNSFFEFLDSNAKYLTVIEVNERYVRDLVQYLGKSVDLGKGKTKKIEMHDSLIMMISKEYGATVITKDRVITNSGLVDVAW